jgi:hypothetical protein
MNPRRGRSDPSPFSMHVGELMPTNWKIQRLTNEELAWLAGIIEGEAYLYLDKRRRSKSNDPDYEPPPSASGRGH